MSFSSQGQGGVPGPSTPNPTPSPPHEHLVKELKVIAWELETLLPLVKNAPGIPPQVVLGINLLEAALAMVNHAIGN